MSKTTVIVLGGVDYEIDLLPIGILRKLDEEFADVPQENCTKKEREAFFFKQALQIIVYGLQTKNPAIDLAKLETIPSDMEEVFAARRAVLIHAGLMVETEKKVGEERAAAS